MKTLPLKPETRANSRLTWPCRIWFDPAHSIYLVWSSPIHLALAHFAPIMLAAFHFFEISKQIPTWGGGFILAVSSAWNACLLLKQPLHVHASMMSQDITSTEKSSLLMSAKQHPSPLLPCPQLFPVYFFQSTCGNIIILIFVHYELLVSSKGPGTGKKPDSNWTKE